MPETSDLFLSAIQRQVTEAVSAISETLCKGSDIELTVDCYGHLKLVEIRKKSLNYR